VNKIETHSARDSKFAWLDLTQAPEAAMSDLLQTATTHNYTGVVVGPEQAQSLPAGLFKVGISKNKNLSAAAEVAKKVDLVVVEGSVFDAYVEEYRPDQSKVGAYVYVEDHDSMQLACELAARAAHLVIDSKDETKIPLELILAEAQTRSVRVVTRVHDALEGEIVMGVLEKGSHGLLLGSQQMEEVIALGKVVAEWDSRLRQELCVLRVTETQHVGMGERACIDTCSYLGLDEGILVGSFSRGGILVCSETHPLPYMPTRPFRINAGALHSYALAPGNRTWYLSDLRSGMELLAVSTSGRARKVTVGRVKIEQRPLLRISGVTEAGEDLSIIMQEDWHVRVFNADGKAHNITTLKPGDRLLAYSVPPGRHVGIAVQETILEQ